MNSMTMIHSYDHHEESKLSNSNSDTSYAYDPTFDDDDLSGVEDLCLNDSDEHDYTGSSTDHKNDFDLRQEYQNAIDCLLRCEHIISALQDQVTKKDGQIATLEEKLVKMSLELASSKAFEDEHRSKRRPSQEDGEDEDDDLSADNGSERSGSGVNANDIPALLPSAPSSPSRTKTSKRAVRRSSTGVVERRKMACGGGGLFGLGSSMGANIHNPMLDESETTMDESSSSRLSSLNFFRKKETCPEEDRDQARRASEYTPQPSGQQQQQQRRRLPNRRRMELRSSLKASIPGVVFPTSFDEVVNKGLRESIKKMNSTRGLRDQLMKGYSNKLLEDFCPKH